MHDPCWGECLLALIAMAYGAWLMLPMDTFAHSLVYRYIAAIAREETWGLIMFLIGLFQLWVVGGTSFVERVIAASLGAFLWIFLAGCALYANPSSGAVPVFTVYAVAAELSLLRRYADA